MSHTPGPWWAVELDDVSSPFELGHNEFCVISSEVANVEPIIAMNISLEANARLLAAAPDLLAVCAEIREAFAYFSEWELPIGFEQRLNKALDKAGHGDLR